MCVCVRVSVCVCEGGGGGGILCNFQCLIGLDLKYYIMSIAVAK